MKTLEDFYNEVTQLDELKKEFLEAAKQKDTVEAFLKKNGCEATSEELAAFLNEKMASNEKEVTDAELQSIAGGTQSKESGVVLGVVSYLTSGIACAGQGIISAIRALDDPTQQTAYEIFNCYD